MAGTTVAACPVTQSLYIGTPGLLYTMLIEGVFKQHVPFQCKKKLNNLQESDINSIVKYVPGQERNDTKDARVFSMLGRFGVDVAIAMSWTMHHNAALSLHKWEKDGKLIPKG